MTLLPGGGEIAGKGAFWAPWLVGIGAEEANCMLSMTASGLLHRFPNLQVLVTHGGGAFPALKGRIEQGIRCRRDWGWPVIGNYYEAMGETERTDTLDDYVHNGGLWVDSITHDPVILDLLLRMHGRERVVFGSDYPFPLGDVTGFLGEGVTVDEERLLGSMVEDHLGAGSGVGSGAGSMAGRGGRDVPLRDRIFTHNPAQFFGLGGGGGAGGEEKH